MNSSMSTARPALRTIALVLTTALLFSACAKKPTNGTDGDQSNTSLSSKNKTMALSPKTGDTIATIKTSKGDIKILLYTEQAPETSKNFIEHAKAQKYDNVPFHRVIDEFMIQTGDFENKNGTGGYSYKGPGTSLEDEFGDGLEHLRGAVSMANAGPDTGGSQFFIVQRKGGTPSLNGLHAIFGFTFDGMDIVDEIAGVETDDYDRPLDEIVIESIEISAQE